MRVSILGAGAIAYGLAVYLAEAGHDPMLWSPSGKRTELTAKCHESEIVIEKLEFPPRSFGQAVLFGAPELSPANFSGNRL